MSAPVPVASLVEDGALYVVMAITEMAQVPGREKGIKMTTLSAYRCQTSFGLVVLGEGEVLAARQIYTQYVALPPTGGLFWEYCGRRLLDECVPRRALSQEQVLGYEQRYYGGEPCLA